MHILKNRILTNPVNGEAISNELEIKNEGGVIWIPQSEVEELYKDIGKYIAELEISNAMDNGLQAEDLISH